MPKSTVRVELEIEIDIPKIPALPKGTVYPDEQAFKRATGAGFSVIWRGKGVRKFGVKYGPIRVV